MAAKIDQGAIKERPLTFADTRFDGKIPVKNRIRTALIVDKICIIKHL
jgi:hypothetical protein